jgi:uncharacterized membrane protein YfcA
MGGLHTVDLILFVAASFCAAFVAGVAGFAFGIVAAAVWLHVLTPAQTAALIAAFGPIVQGRAVWKLRRAVSLGRIAPFLIAGVAGVPIGIEALHRTSPSVLRVAIGALLVPFGIYNPARPKLRSIMGTARQSMAQSASSTARSAVQRGSQASSRQAEAAHRGGLLPIARP